jgi:hypothetical protein
VEGKCGCLLRLVAQPGTVSEPRRGESLAGVCLEMETPREVLASTLCLLEEEPEVQDLETLRLLLAIGISLERGFLDAPLRNPDFCTLNLTWMLAMLPIENVELKSFTLRLVFSILTCSIPDSRAS